jgi:hypothetical protein
MKNEFTAIIERDEEWYIAEEVVFITTAEVLKHEKIQNVKR